MIYTDDAGIVSESEESLAKMMMVIVTVFKAADFTVSWRKAEPCCCEHRTRHPEPHRSSSNQQA